jgi:hypothetical protein
MRQTPRLTGKLGSGEDTKLTVLNSLPAHIAVLDQAGSNKAVNEAWLVFARQNSGHLTSGFPSKSPHSPPETASIGLRLLFAGTAHARALRGMAALMVGVVILALWGLNRGQNQPEPTVEAPLRRTAAAPRG